MEAQRGDAMLEPGELLARMGGVFRHDIGPAVQGEFPKTQAFMASVILGKLSAQLRTAPAHAAADHADRGALAADLAGALQPGDPLVLRDAVAGLSDDARSDRAALHAVVTALYSARAELGAARFEALLGRARTTLRARLDRQLEHAS